MQHTSTIQVREAAIEYQGFGWSSIPVPFRSKNPGFPGWQDLRIKTVEEIAARFNGCPQNIGILTGTPSNGLVDIDLDVPEALPIAGKYLPETRRFGRKSNPESHWLFYVDPPPGIVPFEFGNKKLLEMRGTGGQTVAPPSVHPNGEQIFWANQSEVIRFPLDELSKLVAKIAAAILLTRAWPRTKGTRDDLAMALAGALLRGGWLVDDVSGFIEIVCRTAGDEEHRDRAKKAKFTDEKLKGNHPVTGWPTLAQILGKDTIETVCRWLKIEPKAKHDTAHLGLTDLGNARRLVDQHGADLRYVHTWGRWFFWSATHWQRDETGEVIRRGKSVVRSIYAEASDAASKDDRQAVAAHAQRSESESKLKSMVSLAESELEIAITPEKLDTESMLLNVANGTIDLATGNLRPHDRGDYITRCIPIQYDPAALCPRWGRFLEEIFPDKPELIDFVQRAVGYSLTGETSEQVFFLCWGSGANGKSTATEVLRSLVGEYGRQIPAESLMVRRVEAQSNDLAILKGARLVTAAESEEGQRLAESRVKSITGGDTVVARHLYSEFFEFQPEFKLWLSTNHKPVIRGTDLAIWRRVRLIPFDVSFPPEKQDRGLLSALRAELDGILAWAVRGCLAWRKIGLAAPEEVLLATEQYRSEMDVVAMFLDDCCIQHVNAECSAEVLYKAFSAWAAANGERTMTATMFGRKLSERGFERCKSGGYRKWRGLGLLQDEV